MMGRATKGRDDRLRAALLRLRRRIAAERYALPPSGAELGRLVAQEGRLIRRLLRAEASRAGGRGVNRGEDR
jgi:hypothetical protein